MKHAKSALTALEKAIRDFDEKGRNSQFKTYDAGVVPATNLSAATPGAPIRRLWM
jgi:hypothetical protein